MPMYTIIIIVFLALCNSYDVPKRMYETRGVTAAGAFDCLHDVVPKILHDDFFQSNARFHTVRFCRQSISNSLSKENKNVIYGNPITFDYLRSINITSEQLFNWYASMDTIEEYESGVKVGLFINCSQDDKFWFGPNCEYTFNSPKYFPDIVDIQFYEKKHIPDDLLSINNSVCFETGGIECQSVLCLDWREICDGKIDCTNGFDEIHCHALEINDCDPSTEYRCLNGQCIDKTFYWDSHVDCMDYSDEMYRHGSFCFDAFDLRCEDTVCPSTWFSCGDGDCSDGPSLNSSELYCKSHRDRLYFKQMPLSKIILFSNIHIIYDNLMPITICFNKTLCPYLFNNDNTITTNYDGLYCRAFETFSNATYVSFSDMIKDLKRFVLSCSLLPKNDLMNNCTLFKCNDGNGEDEHQSNTCNLNLPYRFKCYNGIKCVHQSSKYNGIDDCDDRSDEDSTHESLCLDQNTEECYAHRQERHPFNMTFSQLCNRILERTPDTNNDTDESNCPLSEWNCLTHYTKCNKVWNCPDGHDELSYGYAICLQKERIGDGIIDCVGSLDEREFCRIHFPYEFMRRYRCQNSTKCILIEEICDCHQHCPLDDDETIACHWLNNGRETNCDPNLFRCRNGQYAPTISFITRCYDSSLTCNEKESQLFCDLNDRSTSRPFLTIDMKEIPELKNNRLIRSLSKDIDIIHWYCNRGVYVYSPNSPLGFYCMCTDSYYGDRCQFQRKRIAVFLQLRTTSLFNSLLPLYKIVILLVRNNSSNSIISHDQILYTPYRYCLPRYLIQLYYPINQSLFPLINHSVHIHVFVAKTLEYRTSWIFPVPFEFLPVNRIAKQLYIPDSSATQTIQFNTTNCTSCSNVSRCIGYDTDLGRDICVCPLNLTGRRCFVPFNPCVKQNCSGHGECLPADSRYYESEQYICICHVEWFGDDCETMKARIHVIFASNILIPSSNIVFLHSFKINLFQEPIHFTYFHRLRSNISNYTFYLEEEFLDSLIFIQLYENRDQNDFYLLLVRKPDSDGLVEINSEVDSSRRCRPINELFNSTIINLPKLHRVKYYQQVCLEKYKKENLMCFYDDQLMCLCDQRSYSDCFNFEPTSYGCPENKCNGRGICVQNHHLCPRNSLCLCEPCTYGELCQFSRAGYSLSLDAIIGSHIRLTTSKTIIKISVILISCFIIIGFLMNILGIGTFYQRTTQDVGSGIYLLISSCFGLLTSITLTLKLIFLFIRSQGSVLCAITEFLIKLSLISCECLNACVAIERTLAIKRETKFSRLKSKIIAKWISILVPIIVAIISSPELIYRRMVIDAYDETNWCVLTLNADQPILLTLYSTSNICLFVIPLTINLICSIIIIIGIARIKQRTAGKVNNIRRPVTINLGFTTINMNFMLRIEPKSIRAQIVKHKHLLIAPILLAIFAIPRLVFAFVFVCSKLDRHPFVTLPSYLIGFLPSMSVLFAFILPSEVYRRALFIFARSIVPVCVQNYFLAFQQRS
ncbi:hypothetical protein I4U23_004857 [Adineta vaga]|nr:hypothetical protein I4U23_004857 [Adineta vaga]